MLLGAGFLLMAITLCTQIFATPESDYELNSLPISDYERSQVITVDSSPQPEIITAELPITITSTQQIQIDNNDYILITYSNGSTQIMPIEQYETEIHVSVEDNDHHHSHHDETHHNHDDQWTQDDFNRKYGNSLPDDGKISDDDNSNIQHPSQHHYTNDHNTEVKSTPSTHNDNNNSDSSNSDSSSSSDSDSGDSGSSDSSSD